MIKLYNFFTIVRYTFTKEDLMEVKMNNTEKIKKRYNRVAKFYDILESPMEMMSLKKRRIDLMKELRDKVSSREAMLILADLEKKYRVDLAIIVMKVMVRILDVKNLTLYFVSDLGLDQNTAENLDKELLEKIFSPVADYLGLAKEVKALDLESDINLVIREVGLVLPSSDLVSRLKTILSTYLKGIRSKEG